MIRADPGSGQIARREKMTKKEICTNNPTIGFYYDGLAGLEIKYIEHGINDYVYYIAQYGELWLG